MKLIVRRLGLLTKQDPMGDPSLCDEVKRKMDIMQEIEELTGKIQESLDTTIDTINPDGCRPNPSNSAHTSSGSHPNPPSEAHPDASHPNSPDTSHPNSNTPQSDPNPSSNPNAPHPDNTGPSMTSSNTGPAKRR